MTHQWSYMRQAKSTEEHRHLSDQLIGEDHTLKEIMRVVVKNVLNKMTATGLVIKTQEMIVAICSTI